MYPWIHGTSDIQKSLTRFQLVFKASVHCSVHISSVSVDVWFVSLVNGTIAATRNMFVAATT